MSRTTCNQSKRSDKTSNAPNPNTPDFFDNLYNGFWKTEGSTSPYEYEDPLRLEFYKKLASLPFFDSCGKILDVGCGTGGVFGALPRDNQLKKYGIDFSSVAIEEIRRRFPDGIFVTGDVHHLPFPDNFFDRIICTETLEHVDDPAAVVAEMYRVLKEHGKILITVPEESLDLDAEAWPGGMSLQINKFSMATLSALSESQGFTIDTTKIDDREIWLTADKVPASDKCRRAKTKFILTNVDADILAARALFEEGKYLDAFDLYEQMADYYRHQAVPILAEAYDLFQLLPEKEDRYHLYQARYFDFGIKPSDKVLDIGSGHLPFPFATHLADISLDNGDVGRAGIPFKHLHGKPVYECNIERLPFADKEFDFVYCSHVLEHVDSPEDACRELMRVARRGYIETPTRGKDLWLNSAKISNHRWAVEFIHGRLIFTEYTTAELDGLNCDLLMSMHCSPRSAREKAFSALVYLKADMVNTMVYWEGSFDLEVRRLAGAGNAVSPPSTVGVEPASIAFSTEPAVSAPSCLFLNTYYDGFINEHYRRNPGLDGRPYLDQKASLQGECFGDSDFYSEGLKRAGWQADDLILNCRPLQDAWARENGCGDEGPARVIEQIRRAKPSVVYLQNLGLATKEFLSAIRPYTELIVGQIACPIPPQAHLHGLDIIFSSFPHYVIRFRERGITAYYQPLAFDPKVLEKIGHRARRHPVTFVGGISAAHGKGKEYLEKIAELVPVDFWGYGAETLPADSPIRMRHHGETWGIDMFSVLAESRITINRHIDVAENYANNMRLFEATGCGALLITDYKDNLGELFEIGREVVAYRSPEECAALIKYYQLHPEEGDEIARAGQARTLRDHTYARRMEQTAEILERHLRYRREKDLFPTPDLSKISYGHTAISVSEITPDMTSAWQDEGIPARQRALVQKELALVQKELAQMYRGKVPIAFQVLADAIKPLLPPGGSILEIGCASGYYYEILEYLLNRRIDYTGVDYSEPLIAMARDYYPKAKFFTADGACLFFADRQFHTVVSSGILLHVPNWRQHIFETARVADRFVVAHRTPICRRKPTQHLKKFAYGVKTVEIVFNEVELLREFAVNGLNLIRTLEFYSNPADDSYDVTYVFAKAEKDFVR